MAQVSMRSDLSTLIDALVAGNTNAIIEAAREHLRHGENADTLIGRIGMIAVHGDSEGHTAITLAAATMLARLIHTIPQPTDADDTSQERALPLFVQALITAIPAVRAGYKVEPNYPQPLFPSEYPAGKTGNQMMHDAVYGHDALQVERLLFGFYGSGADYRTMEVRTYEGIATTFQHNGHPRQLAVGGFQLLDAVEWGDRAPNVLHWLAPHLALSANIAEPAWIQPVRDFAAQPAHSLTSVRTRLSAPRDGNALPLRTLITSDADTIQVCQGVYDALITGGASARAVAAVISLAAADLLQTIDDSDREQFVHVAHGLLFATATHHIFRRVQDVEALPALFTSAAFINALYQEVAQLQAQPQQAARSAKAIPGGGLIAGAQLETLSSQLKAQDISGALTTAQRYLKIGHDPRALFATIGLVAAQTDATDDQGHTLQITQAASEEFLSWPAGLADTDHEALLRTALHAAAFGKRDTVVSTL
jgi:hypothetical protein